MFPPVLHCVGVRIVLLVLYCVAEKETTCFAVTLSQCHMVTLWCHIVTWSNWSNCRKNINKGKLPSGRFNFKSLSIFYVHSGRRTSVTAWLKGMSRTWYLIDINWYFSYHYRRKINADQWYLDISYIFSLFSSIMTNKWY